MNEDWTKKEVEVIVEDYFTMLQEELKHYPYNKAAHNRRIQAFLNNRSKGSVEFKHANISAALINMGLPYIKGYQPRFNYQKKMLEEEIADYIKRHQLPLENQFAHFADESGTSKQLQLSEVDFKNVIETGPVISEIKQTEPLFKPTRINYLEREQNNRRLGEKGEEFVIDYERWRLIQLGKENFADRIEWISKDKGDGLGFDILSRNENGTDRYIEVKTTKLAKETPIYLSGNEIAFAAQKTKDFFLYRVFNFDVTPKMFIKHGQYKDFCKVIPHTFKGYFE